MPQHVPNYNFPKIKLCKKGHAVIGTNIVASKISVRCRNCYNETKLRGSITDATAHAALERLLAGETLKNLDGPHRQHESAGQALSAEGGDNLLTA